MGKTVIKSMLFLGLSFSAGAAVSVIGPDGQVELFYQEGDRVIAKECKDHGILNVVDDCEAGAGDRVRQYDSVADFREILSVGLRVNVKAWDKAFEEKIVFYNKWRAEENIKKLVKDERYLMEEIAAREAFAQKYGQETIDVAELEGLKSRLVSVENELNLAGKVGHKMIGEVEAGIDGLIKLVADSHENLHHYIFPFPEEGKGMFDINVLKAFWDVGVISNFQEIPVGSFMMGSPVEEEGRLNDEEGIDGKPVKVNITRAFEMMTTEVTQGQWVEVMGQNLSRYNQPEHCGNHEVINGISLCPDNPVEGVSWSDIQEFIAKLNDKERIMGCDGTPRSAKGCYRLPTEAEWEYAARGGSQTAYSFGDSAEDLEEYAWYGLNSGRQTHEVGQLKANPFGLYDMHGNVWEWVQDGYVEKLPGGQNPFQAPAAGGVFHVVRGGSWFHIEQDLRSAFRKGVYPNNRYNNIGFRLVRTR